MSQDTVSLRRAKRDEKSLPTFTLFVCPRDTRRVPGQKAAELTRIDHYRDVLGQPQPLLDVQDAYQAYEDARAVFDLPPLSVEEFTGRVNKALSRNVLRIRADGTWDGLLTIV
jgi:hypothetical protein